MSKAYSNIKGYPSYTKSPFQADGIIERYIKKKTTSTVFANTETGELGEWTPSAEFNTREVDTLEFRKVYVDYFKVLMRLPVPAYKVFFFLMSELPINKAEVDCNIKAAMEFTGYKTALDIYKGLTHLLNVELIARKVDVGNKFFINPNAFFNGRRVANQVEEDYRIGMRLDEEATEEYLKGKN